MANEGAKKGAAKKAVKKKWAQIIAPKSFDSMVLGESLVENAEKLVGKTVNANLMNLTGDMRNQGVEIRFDVIKAADGKGYAAVTGYEVLPSTLKRVVRRGRTKVADSFVLKTATGRLLRIKPVIITSNQCSAGAATAIRAAVRDRLKQIVGSMSFDKVVHELIQYKLQRAIKDAANKLHPVKGVEVRQCLLLAEGSSERREVREDSRVEDFVEVVPPTEEKVDETAEAPEPEKAE